MLRCACLIPPHLFVQLFDSRTLADLEETCQIVRPLRGDRVTEDEAARLLQDADIVITSWGSPNLSHRLLEKAPGLKLIAHAAGSVKGIVSDAVWDRGVRLVSSAAANAEEVAIFTTGLMSLGRKNAFRISQEFREGKDYRFESGRPHDLYRCRIGLVGAGHIGRKVARLIEGWEADVRFYDPFMSPQDAAALGASLEPDLDSLVKWADILSVHAPNLPETRHMLGAHNLPLMPDGSVLINTARGALIDEDALIRELETGRIYACLDVTSPEPPAPDSPLRTLPNVFLTPHIAGCMQEGIARMGALAVREIRSYIAGDPLTQEITRKMLAYIA